MFTGHGAQRLLPADGVMLPGGHSEGAVEPAKQYEPTGHCEQSAALVALDDPE